MDETMTELARRAVTCKGWRWMAGMAGRNADGPFRVDVVDGGRPCKARPDQWHGGTHAAEIRSGPRPDLTDSATLGCLRSIVEDLHEHPVWLEPADDFEGWLLMGCYACPQTNAHAIAEGPTEAAALVAALEAAHG